MIVKKRDRTKSLADLATEEYAVSAAVGSVKKIEDLQTIDGNAWNPTKVYVDGDTIIYGGSFARCLHTNRGIKPTNKVYWELLTVSDMILELMERVSALEQEE